MAAIPISTTGVSIYVRCKGYVYFEVTGAKSITYTEAGNKMVVFDLSTFRDVLSAGDLGRAWGATSTIPFVSPSVPENTDDRPNHTAPREWPKPDMVIMWWDALLGAGNCIGACRYADFLSYSNAIPKLML